MKKNQCCFNPGITYPPGVSWQVFSGPIPPFHKSALLFNSALLITGWVVDEKPQQSRQLGGLA
jgi:hypothetical protein